MHEYGDPTSAPFWEAAEREELLVQRCRACSARQLHPRVLCIACGSLEIAWERASGRGTVVAATVVHVKAHPTLEPPYTAALVQLEEGPRVLGNPAGAVAGDAVRLVWQAREGLPPLPQWELA